MADLLVQFLIAMDKDEKLKQMYLENPAQTARDFGLSEADIQICVSNDFETMKKRCDSSGAFYVHIDHPN